MVEFSAIGYHLGRLGRFVVIWSSNNFAQPPLFFQVFRHSLRGGGDLINEATILLDGLLLGKITFTDWVSFVDGLPSPKRYNL